MKEYFDINISDLQNTTKWAVEYSSKALEIYETRITGDQRPRKAIEGVKDFLTSGKRTNGLRILALDAYRSSVETKDVIASYAAKASSLTAAVAFTHPYRDIKQAEHLLGPVVYSALSEEMMLGNEEIGDRIIERAIATASNEVALLLGKYPKHEKDNTRLERLYCKLDSGIRQKLEYKENGEGKES